MENIINTFYKGNINKFGFGGWNTTKNNIPEILGAYPYPSNANRQIDRYFQKSNIDTEGKSKNLHQNYIPNIIRDNIKPGERVDFSKANAMEIKPISISQYKNFDNYGFMNTQTKEVPKPNFSPALIRMEYLENKVRDIENKNRAEMVKSLNDINKNIDPRFKQFLDNNQDKYNVFGNDIDPLDQRRLYVQNNLGNMRNKLNVEERKERIKRKKKEKKLKKKKKKKKKKFFSESEESANEEEEQNEENAFLNNEDNNNINNINTLAQKTGSPQVSPPLTRMSSKAKETQGGLRRKSLLSTLVKNTIKSPSKIGSRRNSIQSKKNMKKTVYSSIEQKESKEVKQTKEAKVCGDIGYTFTAKNKKEKELQYQTNRLGKDFDKLLNEIREFKRVIKEKINTQNTDETNRLNVYKDIFLLDNKAKMKYAVDRVLFKSNEIFDPIQYQKKVDNERFDEINDVINKKIEDYNNNMDKVIYNRKINNEKKQMIYNNIINKYEYKKYKGKLNNQIMSLPNIYIEPTKNMKTRQQKKNKDKKDSQKETESNKKTDSKYTPKSEKKKSAYVNEISEETVKDFGTSIIGNDQYRTKKKRELDRKSETFIDLPDIKKSKKSSKITPSIKSLEIKKSSQEGKIELMKVIKEKEDKEKKEKSKKSKKATTNKTTTKKSQKTTTKKTTTKKEEEEKKEEEKKEEEEEDEDEDEEEEEDDDEEEEESDEEEEKEKTKKEESKKNKESSKKDNKKESSKKDKEESKKDKTKEEDNDEDDEEESEEENEEDKSESKKENEEEGSDEEED